MPPPLTLKQILARADAHRERTGKLPNVQPGAVLGGAKGETWRRLDAALRYGFRGLPGGSSLAKLLAQRRGYWNHCGLPDLTVAQILRWADAYRQQHGRWPNLRSGSLPGTGESWFNIDAALRYGTRVLAGRDSLSRLLARRRGVPHRLHSPRLTVRKVLGWAMAHRQRTGRWPAYTSGPIAGAEGETWSRVDYALRRGPRGLPGGSSVAKLLVGLKERAKA